MLRDNPLAEGHMGEGDLLRAVLTRNSAVWSAVWSVYPDPARQTDLHRRRPLRPLAGSAKRGRAVRGRRPEFPTRCGAPVVGYGAVHRRRPWVLVVRPGNLRCAGAPGRWGTSNGPCPHGGWL
ncbi:hypothetical protein [Streptomyces sp. NPDC057690]|uniref:hypothetical protein n=1 Tax=Streptomyces sp. NPDC057690 TaxID=3346214 RepID=UPI0036C6C19B